MVPDRSAWVALCVPVLGVSRGMGGGVGVLCRVPARVVGLCWGERFGVLVPAPGVGCGA